MAPPIAPRDCPRASSGITSRASIPTPRTWIGVRVAANCCVDLLASMGVRARAAAAAACARPSRRRLPMRRSRARSTRALEAGALRGARVGALVVDDADGRVVFDRSADQPLVPASNLKILTALAALRVFGPAHAFTTRVYADAAPDREGARRDAVRARRGRPRPDLRGLLAARRRSAPARACAACAAISRSTTRYSMASAGTRAGSRPPRAPTSRRSAR